MFKTGQGILNFQFTPKKERVLGIVCDQLKIQYKDNLQTHYYNSDSIRINPDWFKNFRRDGEYQIDEKERSIFIKSENEYAKFIIISVAKKIVSEPIDDVLFKIAANAIFAEMK